LKAAPRWALATPQYRESELESGHGLIVLVAAGTAWLLLAGDPAVALVGCAGLSPWLFVRTPLLIAIICGFSCFAADFGRPRGPDEE
jgi:hypothetical protein